MITSVNTKEKKSKIILVIVAHPDDETLGMGGTIAYHTDKGDKVFGIYMTDGVGARKSNYQELKDRKNASINAASILGLKWLEVKNFPDNQMDTIAILEVIQEIERIKFLIKPDLVYTHNNSDLNIDHRVISQAVLTAFRPIENEVCQEIRTFEIPSATDYGHRSITGKFNPCLYIDLKKTWDKKLKALMEYKMEMRSAPNSRSIEGIENLAKYRGNQVGIHYAEAFEIIRKIERS